MRARSGATPVVPGARAVGIAAAVVVAVAAPVGAQPSSSAARVGVVSMARVSPDARESAPAATPIAWGSVIAVNAAGAVVLAGADQLLDDPAPWDQGTDGFRRRLAMRGVQFAVAGAGEVLLARAWRQDIGYHPCECRGAWSRTSHVLVSALTVVAEDGRRVPAWPIVLAAWAGAAAAAPMREGGTPALWAATRPLTTLAARAALGAFREVTR